MLYRSAASRSPRKGLVLVAVLVVVTVLSLAAYQYSELMAAEARAADSHTRSGQTYRFALSGVHYTAAILADQTYFSSTLNNNPFDNDQYFRDILVQDDDNPKRRGHFTIIALRSPDDPAYQTQGWRFGVEDEASKINVNALIKYDKTGAIGTRMLGALPNMTPDAIDSIMDWINSNTTSASSNGAKDYTGMNPAYHCKNGPLDSIDELLLVNGVTSDLLWGNDLNFNGQLDPGEVGGSGNSSGADRGLAAYLTVFSREANVANDGTARVFINDKDINTLQNNLATALANSGGNAQNLINFIIAYRMYGPAAATGANTGTGKTGTTAAKTLSSTDQQAALAQITTDKQAAATGQGKALTAISSVYSLINASVSITTGTGRNARTITLPSPLSDPSQQATLLPVLLDKCTTTQNTDLSARINVNTASQTVLMTLVADQTAQSSQTTGQTGQTGQTTQAPKAGGLQATDVQKIITNQPQYSSASGVDDSYMTPAWLITKAGLSPQTVQAIEPFITARSTVYRFQVLGYFEGGGPVTRLEAVVDTNFGRPRIVYVRNLSELGKVYDMSQIQN